MLLDTLSPPAVATHAPTPHAAPVRAGCIAVDARCLQDPEYAGRGIGRHALGLLRHAPRQDGRKLIGLVDPALPNMAPEHAALFDGLCRSARASGLNEAAALLSPSPMTHDPLFTARLVADPRVVSAAVVHDFIPYRQPQRYLAGPGARVAYAAGLRWLARHRLFLANSQATAAELRDLLRVPAEQVAVTGTALDASFPTPATAGTASHVLVVGGADPRKNVGCAVRAHAAVPALRWAGVALVITGRYGAAEQAALRQEAERAGGAGALLRFPGHVSDTALRALYAGAVVVVAPSRAEGFDLPVIEAMASGAPVVASDIPPHRELVDDAWRFAPDDDARLAALLAELWERPSGRAALVARQQPVWRVHRAQSVAARLWEQIGLRLAPRSAMPRAPTILRRAKPRLALLTPLPPDQTGVGDHVAACCPELAALTELHLFSPTANPADVPGAASVRPLHPLACLSPGFDRVVHVMGNSEFHLPIFNLLLRHGGACIAHDSRMLGFYRILLGARRAAAVAGRELGRVVEASELEAWMADETRLPTSLLSEVAAAADPLLVHSPVTAALLGQQFGRTPGVLPFAIHRSFAPHDAAARSAARSRLGLPESGVMIASFGFVHANKAPEECIWALEVMRGWGIDAALHFVGAGGDTQALKALAAQLGLTPQVVFRDGYVSEAAYRDYLYAADLGVQLRQAFPGSLSGALLDCIAAGLPSVANAGLAEAMEAPGYVRRIPDAISPLLLAEALTALLSEGLAQARPEAVRRDWVAAHDAQTYAARLCAALELDVRAPA